MNLSRVTYWNYKQPNKYCPSFIPEICTGELITISETGK